MWRIIFDSTETAQFSDPHFGRKRRPASEQWNLIIGLTLAVK
jgi:hypothetical protein